MNFNKSNNIIFFFAFFLCTIKVFTQENDNKIKPFQQNGINIEHKIKSDECKDPISKDISLVEEKKAIRISKNVR